MSDSCQVNRPGNVLRPTVVSSNGFGGRRWVAIAGIGFGLAALGWAQNAPADSGRAQTTQTTQAETKTKHSKAKKPEPSPGRQVANGTGNIAGGAGKGAGDLAKGTGKGAADLATLHPIDAAGSVGKGAAGAGKDVAVGTTKGTGKVVKGIGRGIKHIL
ncbi:MAG: hypothetical protein JO108_02335 [Acidobacteriaceae bacterium]|nr:hypothetical protein [Acidobacteriaceae bacterium]